MTGELQSVLFDKDKYGERGALKWLRSHVLKTSQLYDEAKFIHARQMDPKRYKHIASIDIGRGIIFRIGYR